MANGETGETEADFIFGGSKITADGDCSHEIKRCLLLGRKVMTNLDSILKSRGITLPTKVCLVKAMVFPVIMYGCKCWTVRKLSTDELILLNCGDGEDSRVPWTARRSNQSILKEINPGVHWKDWCWSWNSNTLATWCKELPHLKRLWCWEGLRAGGEGDDRGWDGWMDQLNGHGFGWTPGFGDGQGGLVCFGSWGCRESDMTEWLNWTDMPMSGIVGSYGSSIFSF